MDIELALVRVMTEGERAAACLRPGSGFTSPIAHSMIKVHSIIGAMLTPFCWMMSRLDASAWALAIVHAAGNDGYKIVFELGDQIRSFITLSGVVSRALLVYLLVTCLATHVLSIQLD